MGTGIRLKPKGQDGPIIEGELVSPPKRSQFWDVRLAPGIAYNSFAEDEWEEVLPEFELPTKRYAVVEAWDDDGEHVFIKCWSSRQTGDWNHACSHGVTTAARIMSDYTDHRIVFEGEE